MSGNNNIQFNEAFGEHTGISANCRHDIYCVKNNDANEEMFRMSFRDARQFTDLSWRLLGRYIANSIHLKMVDLSKCGLTDEKMASLFYELKYSNSLTRLDLVINSFGIDGLRSMIPFLKNSPNLSIIYLYRNNNISTDGFELLVQTLHGRPVKKIYLQSCNITDISALDTYNLPDLQHLNLGENNISREGCITIANLLQQEGSNLIHLDLDGAVMGDGEAELLATSLENNTKLNTLYLQGNNITERGCKAFLKRLVDVSSIKNTYSSNHTLTNFWIKRDKTTMIGHINSAVQLNKLNQSSRHSAGRAKVIRYQLNSQNRQEMCRVQGIEYRSIGNLFADIEPNLLPRILALIGSSHGQSELYTALIPMVPDLMSCVDTRGMIKDLMARKAVQMAELTRQLAVLSVENDQLSRRLAARESSGDSRHSAIVERTGETAAESGKKRQRSEE